MFQGALTKTDKENVVKLEKNCIFLDKIIKSLSETFDGYVKWNRKQNLKHSSNPVRKLVGFTDAFKHGLDMKFKGA